MSVNSIVTTASALFCGLMLASLAMAQSGPPPQHLNQRTTFETLENTLVHVDFDETRFEDVVNSLQKKLGLPIILNESAADYNLDGESLVTFSHPSDLRAATTLDLLVKPYDCTWTIQDGVIHIISTDVASELEWLNVMTFDCDNLVKKIKPLTIHIHPDHIPHNRGSGDVILGGGAGGIFAIPPQQSETPEEEVKPAPPVTPTLQHQGEALLLPVKKILTPMDQLQRLITKTVSPGSWSEFGGSGSIIAVNHVLVIRQTQSNLRQINQLLEQLRAANLEN